MTEIVNYPLRLQISRYRQRTPTGCGHTHGWVCPPSRPLHHRAWVPVVTTGLHTCVESRRMVLMNLFAGQERGHRQREPACGHSGGRRGRDNLRQWQPSAPWHRRAGWGWAGQVRVLREEIHVYLRLLHAVGQKTTHPCEAASTNSKCWREKREPSSTAGGNVNWCSHYGEKYGDSLKKN